MSDAPEKETPDEETPDEETPERETKASPAPRLMSFKQKVIIVCSLGLLTLAGDQAAKVWARGALLAPGEIQLTRDSGKKAVIHVLGDRPGVEFRLSYNKGAAFGLFGRTTGARIFLSVIGILALILVFYLLRRPESDSRLFVYSLGLVAGGAVGNLLDRVAFGQVTDFIWAWVTPSIKLLWPWPAWNIADAGLVVGVLLMIPAMIFQRPRADAVDESEAQGGKKGTEAGKSAAKTQSKAKTGKRSSGGGKKKRRK